MFPVVSKKIGYAGFAVGLLLMGVAAGIFFLPDGNDGYPVQRTSIGMLVPPPNHPFSFNETPTSYVITVAPSAH